MFRNNATRLVGALSLVLAGSASAAVIIDGDENSQAFAESGYTIVRGDDGKTLLVGEGRAGDSDGAAEKEVTAGGDTSGPLAAVQHTWSGEAENFSFEYDEENGQSIMTIGNDSAVFTDLDTSAIAGSGLNALILRIRVTEGETISLTDLMLDGIALGMDFSYSRGAGDPSASLALFGPFDGLLDGFLLEGTVAFPQIDSRLGSQITFQIKGAQTTVSVPLPATLPLLAIGLLGLRWTSSRVNSRSS